MNFFISWTRSDPIFCEFFDDCNMLISPINATNNFNLGKWNTQPNQVIIDSSAFYFLSNSTDLPTQEVIFEKQMRIIKGAKCPVTICPLDHPINPKKSNTLSTFLAIEKTLGNTYEFLNLCLRYETDKRNIDKMGVIQGNDRNSIHFCAKELKKMGFEKFGLGSLAALFNHAEITDRIEYASEIVGGDNLHVFGISRLDIVPKLNNLRIQSIDSTRPTKAAIFNAIFYSNPFTTYGIYSAKNSSSYNKLLKEPLPCNCPSCKINPYLIMKTGLKKYINARAIHNYYHLLKHLKNTVDLP